MQIPPGQRYSGEQSRNSQDLSEMPPIFGYRTALSGGNYLIIQVVMVHGMGITKIMTMSSLGKIFKKTLKCGLNIRNTFNINLKKVNHVI